MAQIIDESNVARVPKQELTEARRAAVAGQAQRRSEQIMTLWREGLSVAEIHERCGIPWRAIRQTVAQLATDADRNARHHAVRARPSDRRPRFSDQQLLEGVRLVATRVSHPPTGPEYAREADALGLAHMQTVIARFGGWRRALRAAGFDAPSQTMRSPRWDIASCWTALVSVAQELGQPPRYRRYLEIAAGRDDLPSGSTLTLRLGLWPEVVAALQAYRREGADQEAAA